MDLDPEQLDSGRRASNTFPERLSAPHNIPNIREGSRREWDTSPTRIPGAPKSEITAPSEVRIPNEDSFRDIQRIADAEYLLLLQRSPGNSMGRTNGSGKTERPKRRCVGNTEWRYHPSPMDGSFSDDDTASSGYLEPLSSDITESSSQSEYKSGDRLSLGSRDYHTSEDDDFMGSSRSREDEFCPSSPPKLSRCFAPRRPKLVQSGNPYGDIVRRRLHFPSTSYGSNPPSGPRPTTVNSYSLFSRENSSEHNEGLHNE